VRNNGVDTVYINGVAQGTGTIAPLAAVGSMVIAANASHGENLSGDVDDVAVFTFSSGAFSTSDLLYFQQQAMPEPSTISALALGLSALWALSKVLPSALRRSLRQSRELL
jgi:hypothetical protein